MKTTITKTLAALMLLLAHPTAHSQNNTETAAAEQPFYTPAQFIGITVQVTDLNTWLAAFGEIAGKYNSYSVLPIGFSQDAANPNLLIVGYAYTDPEKARQYTASEQLKNELKKGGITGTPQITFYHVTDAVDPAFSSLNGIIVTQQVTDYHTWRETFFATENERLAAGISYLGILRNLDKPKEISVIFSYYNQATARQFLEKEYLKNGMAKAGVEGTPQVRFVTLFSEDQSNNKLPETITDATNAAGLLNLSLTTNVTCSVWVNGENKGQLVTGTIGNIRLPKGTHQLAFKSTQNPTDIYETKYEVKTTDKQDHLHVNLQAAIHQRIVKEKSALDTATRPYNIPMVAVKGGSFTIGNNNLSAEMKEHPVKLKDFYLGQYEVTQKQWKEVMGTNPSHFKNCDNCPVENVSHNDAQEFIKKLNQLTGLKYRLPTEAEWEYAARGGSQSKGYTFSGGNNLSDVAWHGANSYSETHPVGQKQPNELGLYDMTGNVFEWCSDWFSYTYYTSGLTVNPTGPEKGIWKSLRGGSWSHHEDECSPAFRNKDEPTNRGRRTGFRLAADNITR